MPQSPPPPKKKKYNYEPLKLSTSVHLYRMSMYINGNQENQFAFFSLVIYFFTSFPFSICEIVPSIIILHSSRHWLPSCFWGAHTPEEITFQSKKLFYSDFPILAKILRIIFFKGKMTVLWPNIEERQDLPFKKSFQNKYYFLPTIPTCLQH